MAGWCGALPSTLYTLKSVESSVSNRGHRQFNRCPVSNTNDSINNFHLASEEFSGSPHGRLHSSVEHFGHQVFHTQMSMIRVLRERRGLRKQILLLGGSSAEAPIIYIHILYIYIYIETLDMDMPHFEQGCHFYVFGGSL